MSEQKEITADFKIELTTNSDIALNLLEENSLFDMFTPLVTGIGSQYGVNVKVIAGTQTEFAFQVIGLKNRIDDFQSACNDAVSGLEGVLGGMSKMASPTKEIHYSLKLKRK